MKLLQFIAIFVAVFLTSASGRPVISAQTMGDRDVIASQPFSDGSLAACFAPVSGLPAGGFFPIYVSVENAGSEPLQVKVETTSIMNHYSFGNDDKDGSLEGKVIIVCPPLEKRVVEYLAPVHQSLDLNDLKQRSLTIEMSSPQDKQAHGYGTVDETVQSGSHILCASPEIVDRHETQLDNFQRYSSAHSGYNHSDYLRLDPEVLPTDWRGYAGYDLLAFSGNEYRALQPSQRTAIERWVKSGGELIIIKSTVDSRLEGWEIGKNLEGFGTVHLLPPRPVEPKKLGETLAEIVSSKRAQDATASYEYSSSAHGVASLLDKNSMGHGLLILVLIIFAIVVGPLNLFRFAGPKRRHRLFVTTPLISLITSAVLILIIILKDGFGGEGRRLTVIDVGPPESTTAAVVQEQFSRTGILISSNFTLDDRSVFLPVQGPRTDYNLEDSTADSGRYRAKFTAKEEGTSINGDYFSSRSERTQVLKSVRPSRERLTLVSGPGEQPQVNSSFSYPLEQVRFVDGQGRVWTGGACAPGETIALSEADVPELQAFETAIGRFSESRQSTLRERLRRRNSFAVLSDSASAIETHSSIDWQPMPALILGTLSR